MPASDNGSDDEIDERREPTMWREVEDTITDEEDPQDEIFLSVVGNDSDPKPIVIQDDYHKGKFVDPLGILRMPPRTFTGKPQGIDDENYDPVAQLAGLHTSTTFTELVQGMRRLGRKLSSHEQDIKQLVRDNFDRFISCKDVIDGIYERINENEASASGNSTRAVSSTLNEALIRAHRIYDPLLSRKFETDKIRQSLSVLFRFSFLFTLPSKIAGNIREGEYDKAVQHYKKAASIFQDQGAISQISVFMHVFAEVENLVSSFRSTLYAALADPSSSFEAQVRVIRILVDLARPDDFKIHPGQDPKDDPGWYYLNMAASRMIARLTNMPILTLDQPTNLTNNQSTPTTNILGQSANIHITSGQSTTSTSTVYKSVRSACGHVARHLPNMWKMGQHYLEGRFDPRAAGSDPNAEREREEMQAHPSQDMEKLDKAATVRVYFSDETSSVRVDSRKMCRELVDLCLRRVEGDPAPENYSIFTWIEKRRKKDGIKVIRITELGPSEKIYKLHKKWGDKSGISHKFLFKRKDEKFPKTHDPRTLVEDYTLEMRSSSEKEQINKKGKRKGDRDFHTLIISVLTAFSERIETLFFQDNADDDFDADLAATSEESTEEWAFGRMRAQVLDVVTTLSILQRAGMNDRYLVPVAHLAQRLSGHYVARVCGQWCGEVALLYLSVPRTHRSVLLDSSMGLPIIHSQDHIGEQKERESLPLVFAATTKFYLAQFKGIISRGHPLIIQIQTAFGESLKCFADTLHHLAFNIDYNNNDDDDGDDEDDEDGRSAVHKQLKIVAYILEIKNVIIPNLWSHFNDTFKLTTNHQVEEEVLSSPLEVLRHLGNMTIARYIHDRLTTFNKIIRYGIVLAPTTEWASAPLPTGVSEFAMSVLLQFVFVNEELLKLVFVNGHEGEVHRYSFEKPDPSHLLDGDAQEVTSKLLSLLVLGTMDCFLRSLSQLDCNNNNNNNNSNNGNNNGNNNSSVSTQAVYQLRLDFCFIESILNRYTNESTPISKSIHDTLNQMEDITYQNGTGEDEIEIDIDIIIEDTSRRAAVLFGSLTGEADSLLMTSLMPSPHMTSPHQTTSPKNSWNRSQKFDRGNSRRSPMTAEMKFGKDSKMSEIFRKGRENSNIRKEPSERPRTDFLSMNKDREKEKEKEREKERERENDREREKEREKEKREKREREREREKKEQEAKSTENNNGIKSPSEPRPQTDRERMKEREKEARERARERERKEREAREREEAKPTKSIVVEKDGASNVTASERELEREKIRQREKEKREKRAR